jgi:DNA-binding response OmpR family regulator
VHTVRLMHSTPAGATEAIRSRYWKTRCSVPQERITMTRGIGNVILAVDDEEEDLRLIRDALEQSGYRVLQANSYQQGYSVFSENRDQIDLLIADVALPDGNGCELALAVRGDRPTLAVLFVSGHVGAEVCRFYGLDVTDLHYLRKPFNAQELVRQVQRVLSSEERFPRLYQRKVFQSGSAL